MRTVLRGFSEGWRVERRTEAPVRAQLLTRLGAIVLALALAAGVVFLSGFSPWTLGIKAIRSTLGSAYGLQQVGILATPLILTGLAVALCQRMGLWNIGAEGQLFMGAWAATGIGIHFTDLSPGLAFTLMFVAGFLVGAGWILIPTLARVYLRVNEILTTLMLNFVAVFVVNYFALELWRDSGVGVLSASHRIPYELPGVYGTLHVGFLVSVLVAGLLSLMVHYTRWGYEMTLIGGNVRAAQYAGVNVSKDMVLTMLLSGALAGLAGVIEVTGTAHRLSGTLSNEYGYLGIIVSALANHSLLLVVPMGIFLAVLLNAGIVVQVLGLSVNAVLAMTGLILLFAAIGEVFSRYRLVPAGERPVGKDSSRDASPSDQDGNE